ncbi:MAG: DAK2 domain-containing protein [Anaerolineales bacterium]|nr:DAK2 domain-containing protein [Anaerolineales bacterium]
MPETEIDLARLFNTVAKALQENQASLNETDAYNHNHGDNMVNNFKVITRAVKRKKGATPSEQLAYASQVLGKKSGSGSARLYTQGLAQAAAQLQGQQAVTPQNAVTLVQSLMGGNAAAPQVSQPAQPQSSDMLGGLMGALLGGGASAPQPSQPAEAQSSDMLGGLMGALLGGGASAPQPSQPAQPQSSDMLGGLMGALLGGETAQTQPQSGSQAGGGGFDLGTLLTAGAAYMQANQQGASPIEALIQAVMAGSQMNNAPHHSQSGQLVASTLISTIGSMLGGKKR